MIVIVPAVTHQELVLRVLDTRVMARPPSSKDHFKSSFNFKSCVIDGQAYPQLMSFHNDRYNFGSRLCANSDSLKQGTRARGAVNAVTEVALIQLIQPGVHFAVAAPNEGLMQLRRAAMQDN
jgi:hypothetical protein